MTKHTETMHLLQKHFDIALETPEGIKKLCELILTLAMQGKLVKQDPKDQPASELLKEIAAEKQRLVKAGKIRKQEPSPSIKPEEVPYAVPEGWEWCYLNDICSIITDGTHLTPSYEETGVPFISVKNLSSGYINLSDTKFISEAEHEELSKRCNPEKNDVLLTKIGTTGIAVTINTNQKFSLFVSVALLKLIKPFIFVEYITRLINSPLVKKYSAEGTEGVGNKNLVLRKIKSFVVPLPPLAEQRRIVAKIDQLMALCDKLEAERNERNQKRLTVHTAAMNRLLTAPDKATFSDSWQFLTKHFGELYSVKENVAELKKAILQLAVMGKLVPQDPKDQPASELLKEIAAEKQRLVKAGTIRKQEPLPPIKPEEVPYEVPEGWEWVRLGELLPNYQNGISKRNSSKGTEVVVIRLSDISNREISLRDTRKIMLSNEEFKRYELLENDILITRVNGSVDLVGNLTLVKQSKMLTYCDHFIRVRTPQNIVASVYLSKISNTEHFRYQIKCKFVTTAGQKTVNQSHISSLLFPLPPLAEQHRIVAKIDQLMTLCDTLDKQIGSATEKQTAILSAILARV